MTANGPEPLPRRSRGSVASRCCRARGRRSLPVVGADSYQASADRDEGRFCIRKTTSAPLPIRVPTVPRLPSCRRRTRISLALLDIRGTTTAQWPAMKDLAQSRIRQIAIVCQDMARARAFYKETLRLPHLFDAGPSLSFFDCGGVRLMLAPPEGEVRGTPDRKSTRLNSSHLVISYAVFCLKKKKHYSTHSSPLHRLHRDYT